MVKVKKLHTDSIIPTKGSWEAAGYDLYAYLPDWNVTIPPGSNVLIGTGVAITPPEGYFGAIFARSGLANKRGLRPSNAVGVADRDYTGEYMVSLYNDSSEPQVIYHEDRIAQLVFLPYLTDGMVEVDDLEDTARGDGGFGSTGV